MVFLLPKLHKPNAPLRPVMSAAKTVGYGLGNMLTYRLSGLRHSPHAIKDSFDFVKKIRGSTNTDKMMLSFDVTSLFTNVLLTYTIDYILNEMYPACPKDCSDLPMTKQCTSCKKRKDFGTLLRTSTSETHFTFGNKIYEQKNGAAMGASLAPVMGDIFVTHMETTLMDDLKRIVVCEWHRYVDDTFVLVDPGATVDDILSILNNFHPSIKFTHEHEANDSLPFLDVRVTRYPDRRTFETTIYRKPTFTGLMINSDSFVPLQYKNAGINSMVRRALSICSSYTSLTAEFDEVRRIGQANGYPLSFIDVHIGIGLSRHLGKNDPKQEEVVLGCPKKQMYVEIPYTGQTTLTMKKQFSHLSGKLRPDLDVRFFTKPPASVQTFFRNKDPVVKHMQSNIVYSVKCSDCDHSYIGKTDRQAIRRMREHGAPKDAFDEPKSSDDDDDVPVNMPAQVPVDKPRYTSNVITRAQALVLSKIAAATTSNATDTLTTTTTKPTATAIAPQNSNDKKVPIITSSLAQHEKDTDHHINWADFQVVWGDNHPYRLLIKESLLIQAYKPELNRTTHSVPLLIYSAGLPRDLLPDPNG